MPARLRHWAASSSHPLAGLARRLRRGLRHASLPAPKILVLPYLWLFLGLRALVFFLRRRLLAEPLLKAYCTRHGRGVTAGIYVPWVKGRGQLVLGDRVCLNGKVSISFAARWSPSPLLEIGDDSDIGHDTTFVIGREIRIGRKVLIASGVSIRDSAGHASDPALRRAGAPPPDEEVRPVRIHDNVWIGSGAVILPGAEIGEGSVVAAMSVVSSTVAPNTVVAGNPARRVANLTPADAG